jgi:hypothetical protein
VHCMTKQEDAGQVCFFVAAWSDAKDSGTEGCEVARISIPPFNELVAGLAKAGSPSSSASQGVAALLTLFSVRELTKMHTHTVLACQDPYALVAYRLDVLTYLKDKMCLESVDKAPAKIAKLAGQ